MEYDYETEADDILYEDSLSLSKILWSCLIIMIWIAVGMFFIAQYNTWEHSKHPIVIYKETEAPAGCSGMLEIPITPQTEPRRDM